VVLALMVFDSYTDRSKGARIYGNSYLRELVSKANCQIRINPGLVVSHGFPNPT
jgi:hypothetical protein